MGEDQSWQHPFASFISSSFSQFNLTYLVTLPDLNLPELADVQQGKVYERSAVL